ncbi:MAG: signal recognition particle-docking protein FtsY [Candidatus Woesearchaeota archaeon]
MFKALRDKLKGALKKFTKDVEEASEVVEELARPDDTEEISSVAGGKKESNKIEISKVIPNEAEKVISVPEKESDKSEEKKGFFGKIKSMFSKEEKEQAQEIFSEDTKKKKTETAEISDEIEGLSDKKEESSEEKEEDDEVLEEYITDLEEKPTLGVDANERTDEEEPEKESKHEISEETERKPVKPKKTEEDIEEEKRRAKEAREKSATDMIARALAEIKKSEEAKAGKEEIKAAEEKKDEEERKRQLEETRAGEEAEEAKAAKEIIPVLKEVEEPKEEVKELKEEIEESKEEKRGFFSRITDIVTKTTLSEKKFEELFWELEIALLENNAAVEVIEKIKEDLKSKLVGTPIRRGKLEEGIIETLGISIKGLFEVEPINIIELTEKKKKETNEPLVIAFIGVNGSGKTTTIAKIARLFQNHKLKPVVAAADTFRAAAIQQMESHTTKLGVKLIKHDYGSDPAAVAFDAVKFAKQKGFDAVLIDTAGRLHSNVNLMDEMKKIIRVSKPDLKIFIGEAITGNDCVEQAKKFNEAVGIDGVILCKADVDDKGGAAISVSYVTGKPILYLGMGQGYDDLKEFDKKIVLDSLELDR